MEEAHRTSPYGAATSDLTDLPDDIFLLIARRLAPQDCVRCRRVSRAWHAALTRDDVSRMLLWWHFPRCREVRLASLPSSSAARERDKEVQEVEENAGTPGPGPGPSPARRRQRPRRQCWSQVFADVARRYHHLRAARPRLVEKIDPWSAFRERPFAASVPADSGIFFRHVAPWDRSLKFNDNLAAFQHADPPWCLGDDDGDGHDVDAEYDDGSRRGRGILFYLEHAVVEIGERERGEPQPVVSSRLVAHDLETGVRVPVPSPFGAAAARDTNIRRLRCSHGVLVVEWCGLISRRCRSDGLPLYPHYATAYDVRRRACSYDTDNNSDDDNDEGSPPVDITFRSQWDLFPGDFPLETNARFFSTHTATHYALYEMFFGAHPVEQLTIWDISSPSRCGPTVLRRFDAGDLDHRGVRQWHAPFLRELLLDAHNVYVHEEEHRWLIGSQALPTPLLTRHHRVHCTGFPFVGAGPAWYDECCADGDVNMSFCPRGASVPAAARFGVGGGGGGSSSNCTTTTTSLQSSRPRSPSPAPISLSSSSSSPPPPSAPPNPHKMPGGGTTTTASWPGWAPCWRHEEFPYLTVADAVDWGAGVRFAARQCFMMEVLSAFVQPRISVEEEGEVQDGGGGEEEEEKKKTKKKKKKEKEEAGGGEAREIGFADDMWAELMANGTVAGDERWLVGADGTGRITVARF
ncbi:hypothetical protein GGR56DRAFT_335618 [Xylariaceae sp. FL0804]|nr:hypothetical protein GGR56DRAFT_335618 [Xylariaceae sp. FL0804]